MDETVFRADTSTLVRELVLEIGVLVAFWGYAIVQDSATYLAAPVLMSLLVAPRLVRSVSQLVDDRVLVLDSEGLTDRSYGLGFIPWNNIQDVRRRDVRRAIPRTGVSRTFEVIELTLHDEDAFFAGGGWSRAMIRYGTGSGYAGIWISPRRIDAPTHAIAITIRNHLNQHQQAAA